MSELADAKQVAGLIDSLAEGILRRMEAAPDVPWAIVGIRSRGDLLAQRIAPKLPPAKLEGRVGTLDITLYRDDLSEIATQPVVRPTEIPFNIDGLQVVLVDDVLMTGRSIRAALEQLMDLGRPRRVWLAVLVDRGGRELPIAPDDVALDLAASTDLAPTDHVQVHLTPTDEQDAILLRSLTPREAQS